MTVRAAASTEGWRDRPVTALVAAQARTRPDAVAVTEPGRSLTYGGLDLAAAALAGRLRRLGVTRGTIVALRLDWGVDLVVAALAVVRAGAAYLPIDPGYPPARQRHLLADSGAPVLVTRGPAPDGTTATVVDLANLSGPAASGSAQSDETGAASHQAADTGPAFADAAIGPDDLAYLIYTSGSTGRPKGVAATHGSLANLVAWQHRVSGLGPDDRASLVAGVGFDASVLELWPALAAGATVVVPAPEARRSPQRLRDALVAERVTVSFAPTAYVEALVELPWPAETALRLLLTGGDRLHRRPPAGLPFTLVDNYGPAETTVVATAAQVAPGAGEPDIGHPIDGATVRLCDATGRPVAPGDVGELCVGGAGVARGYHGRPDLTADRFRPDPDGPPGARLYRTGDLARWGAAGTLEFLGRADDQVQIRGHRVEPGEVEAVLAEHPDVRSAAVVAGTDAIGTTTLTGYAVARAGRRPQPGELRAYLRERLPPALVPAAVVLLPALPTTANGKIDRAALVAAVPVAPATEPAEGRTPTESAVLDIWREVLGRPDIGPDDRFDDQGGHSLSAVRVAGRIAATFGVDVPLEVFLGPLTPAGLASRVDAAAPPPGPTVEPSEVGRSGAARPDADGNDAALPVSPGQRRLWLLDRMVPDRPLYAVPLSIAVTGPVDPDLLAEALRQVVARHEPLRARFAEVDGEPVQYVDGSADVPLTVVDPVDESHAARLVREAAQMPFDLATGPLLRALLLRGPADEHQLLLCVHHIAVDGWSVGVLLADLAEYWTALRDARPAALPDLPLRHRDLVREQHDRVARRLDDQLAYWRERLDPPPPPLDLPTDRPRPERSSHRGAKRRRPLPPPLLDALRGLGRETGTSLFMVLVAAFQVLLHRHTGREDVVVGVPVAGRDDPRTEPLVGFLTNTVALRTDLSGEPAFTDLLARVRRGVLDAAAHADVPLERVVEELRRNRSGAHEALFDVLFVMQNLPEAAVDARGLRLRLVEEVDNGCAKFDLLLFVDFPAGGDPVLTVEYATDLFDAGTADRLLAGYLELLAAVVAQPARPIGRLPLLSTADRALVRAEPAPPAGGECLHTLVERQVVGSPDAIAVEFGGERLTYAELDRRANGLAHRLRAAGVGPDVPVALCLDRSIELAVAVLGVLKAGGAYVPLDPSYPAARLTQVLDEVAAPVLVGPSRLLDRLPAATGTAVRLDSPTAEADAPPVVPVRPDHLAYVLFTSGSTGRPKGVAMPHRAIANLVQWQRVAGGLGGAARTLQFAALGFDVSCQEILTTWATGGTLVLVPDEVRRDLPALLRVLDDAAVERLFVPFVALHHLAEAARDTGLVPHALRDVVTAGEQLQITPPVAWLMAALPQARLHNHYGPTETHVATAHLLDGDPAGWPRLPSIGRPVAGAYTRILDRRGEPAPVGVPGELHLGGVCLARGYHGRPDLTADRFRPDPTSPGRRLYRTGDLARYRADGTIEFLGRADDQVKIRGHRVEPGEVEAVLAGHPALREAVVVARADTGAVGVRLVAYVVPRTGGDPADWRAYLAERLPDYLVPAAFVVVDALPLTPSGKVDRRALPAPDPAALPSGTSYVAPDSALTTVIVEVWSDVLGMPKVGLDDDFFALGGHSLVATRVTARLREALDVEVPLALLFDHSTVGGLAAALTAAYGPDLEDSAQLYQLVATYSDDEAAALLAELGPRAG
ncbi:amino acid adenylation domain-containing protein [Micromonospora sp. SL4-19]|uniref:amino acid adenylation domain-containing protein n=1 Tax=Micromonospora sp. SL4-19 TaxID=3399129 RepID=UPI003A4DFE3C